MHSLLGFSFVIPKRSIHSCADIADLVQNTLVIFIEIDSFSKEINCAEHEYMNMSPSLIELATPLFKAKLQGSIVKRIRPYHECSTSQQD